MQQREGSCTTQGEIAQVSQKVAIKVIVHDLKVEMQPNGVGGQNLRQNLRIKSLKIYCQSGINEVNVGGMVRFEFKIPYKLQVVSQ